MLGQLQRDLGRAALRAAELKCDIIFKATKVDGIYTADPNKDPNAQRLLIMHPDRSRFPAPLAEVDAGTLHGMSPQEVSRFIGECFTRLIPGLQSRHEKSSENREREGT